MDSSCVAACTKDIALAKWLARMTCDLGLQFWVFFMQFKKNKTGIVFTHLHIKIRYIEYWLQILWQSSLAKENSQL